MQPFYKRFSVITGFVVLLVLLVLNGYVIRRQLAVQVANQAGVAHTEQVLLQLSETESLVKDAETGQRGYLYTGDPRYLEPYNLALTGIDTHIRTLQQLVADDPEQLGDVTRLGDLVRQKLGELAATIALHDARKPDDARALVLSNRGLFTMERIRALVDEMQQEETRLDAARVQAYRRSIGVTGTCIYLASALAAVGLLLLAYFILREMRLREKHAALIRQREEWFRVTLTSLGDAVVATDEHGLVTFINPIAEQLTGRSMAQAKARPIAEVFPIFNEVTQLPVDNPVKKVMELGTIVGLANHTVLQHTDGRLIPIEDGAAPIHDDEGRLVGVVLVFRDATHERKSQEIIRKTEKLAAAARLAATVAHEINNPLEAVGNLIYLAKNRTGVPSQVIADLTLAESELERVSHITRQTLGFYHESKAPAALDVAALLDSVLRLYSNKLKSKKINVVLQLKECPPIQGWPGELQQMISNLISNAADAMQFGGTLQLWVACVAGPQGKVVEFKVEDNGPGIAAEHRNRIFEPFFTTKKDVGNGLGLWTSKEIVERHGGSIQVESRCDNRAHGTVFTVLLPCSAETPQRMAEAV